jgi:hypothetical protein
VALYKKIKKKIDFFFLLKKGVAGRSGVAEPPMGGSATPWTEKKIKNGKIGFALGGGRTTPKGQNRS